MSRPAASPAAPEASGAGAADKAGSVRSLLVGRSRGSPAKQLVDDGLNQKHRALFSKMHLIARGNIARGIADARQTAVGVAHRITEIYSAPRGTSFSRKPAPDRSVSARAGRSGIRR